MARFRKNLLTTRRRLTCVIDHLKSSFSEHEPEASDIIGAAGANHLSDHRPRS